MQSCPKPSNSPPHSPSPRSQPPSLPVCPPQLQALFHGEDRYTCTTIELLRTTTRDGPWGDADGLSSCDISRGRLHEEERLAGDGVPELLGVLGIVPSHGDNLLAETGEFYQVRHFSGTMKKDRIETGQTS